jgi:hypothetical protein
MFVGNLLDYQAARPCFVAEPTGCHAPVWKGKLDCFFESQWLVGMDIVVRWYRQWTWLHNILKLTSGRISDKLSEINVFPEMQVRTCAISRC